MAFGLGYVHGCLIVMLLVPVVIYGDDFQPTRATYYGSPLCFGTATGACGYGEYGSTVNDAQVSGVSRLFRNGSGCGACYQVRCKSPQQCREEGVVVVATDYGEGDRTDFILSTRAYARLAKPNAALELFSYGVVDVEYRRFPCRFPGRNNLAIWLTENSKYPDYLAFVILYQAGMYDVVAAEIWEEEHKQWRSMRRAYGTVFDVVGPPRGPLTIRVLISGSAGVTWMQSPDVIPAEWKAGVAYDSTIVLD